MLRRIILCVGILFVLFSCKKEKLDKSPKQLQIFSFKEEYPDSSLFSDIKYMSFYKNDIYALDINRRDIAVFNEEFEKFHTIGEPGNGPKELTYPCAFYIDSDTTYVLDGGSRSVKSFYNGRFVNSYKLPRVNVGNFFIKNNDFYFSSVTDSSLFIIIPKNTSDDVMYKTFGNPAIFETQRRTIMKNERNIFLKENFMYAVSDNLPFIEKYNIKTLKKVESYDLSMVPIVKSNLDYIKTQGEKPNSYYIYIEDSYLKDNYLYLLCSRLGEMYEVNVILKVRLDPIMELANIWALPNKIYDSFCLSPDYLFVFNHQNSTIEKIKTKKL